MEELELLLKEGEGLTIEFKESFSSKLDKDIVAFANTHGGRIFLGVNDQGKIVGEILTNDLKAKINSLASMLENNGFTVLRQCGIDGTRFYDQKTDRIVTVAMKQVNKQDRN